ncbi:MAG: AMP-binding protein [Chloroflexota bacterium]
MTVYPDPSRFASLTELLDDAAARWPDEHPILSLRSDAGLSDRWSAAELRRRSRLAAWRLHASGLHAGDRLLTWSPSTPRLPAVYWGALRLGVVLVPLDLRMAPTVLRRIADHARTPWLALGTGGQDAPDPAAAGLDDLAVLTLDDLTADPDPGFPSDWEAQLDALPLPDRATLAEVIYTSGTTSAPKGVMLTHGTLLSTLEVCRVLLPPRPHRAVSLLPLSHLFEQAPVLFDGTMIGAEIVYLRSRNPRVIFEAFRELRVTTMVVTPQLLEIFWTGIMREAERQGKAALVERMRRVARRLPFGARRLLFRSLHDRLGGALRLFVVAGAYLPPELQQAWEDIGVVVLQGYGATECGPASANAEADHPAGVVGRTIAPVRLRLDPEDHEILVTGPTVSPGYHDDPAATAAAFTDDGWYRTGDIGRIDAAGRLVLVGRKKNIIVLPNGLNVYPEDIENVLADHGLNQAVVLETAPGRIEAVVLPPGTMPVIGPGRGGQEARDAAEEARVRAEIERIVRAANGVLGMHQRIDGWRLWEEPDFPRTHTLKIRRDAVRERLGADGPLTVREESRQGPDAA